jgi:hypothetical protein
MREGRDLGLLDAGCISGLLVFSLVLPLMLSWRVPQQSPSRRSCLWTVWLGQALLCIGGVAVLASPVAAPFSVAFGAWSCAVCAAVLHWQLRSVLADRAT